MNTYYETGHAKNVANLLKYNQYLLTLGAGYNPANPKLTYSAFTTLQSNGAAKQNTVDTAEETWKEETNLREIAFLPIDGLATQLLAALKSTDAPQQTIDDFAFLVRKMHGDISKAAKAEANRTVDPNNPNPVVPIIRSTSQQSYDRKIEHFSKMILILQGVPSYSPNEVDLQIVSLQARLANLILLNQNATDSLAKLKAARIDRNTFFYGADTGMLDLIKKSKLYILGVYGKTSQQYKAAIAFKFVRVIQKKKAK
jgi:hypothetical protein